MLDYFRLYQRFVSVPVLMLLCSVYAAGQTTAFTYQGQLSNNGTPATGSFDLQFSLFDLAQNGSQQGGTVVQTNVAVVNGIFTVQLDFGLNVFTGNGAQFMQIGVRPGGTSGAFTILLPRVPITPTPYSIRTISAASADNATQLGGVAAGQYVQTNDSRLSDPRTPTAGSPNYIQNGTSQQASSNFNISGNGTVGGTLSSGTVDSANGYQIGDVLAFSVTGSGNVFAGRSISTSTSNSTIVGDSAGSVNTGNNNTFVGHLTGNANTTGGNNVFVGNSAGLVNTTGNGNVVVGEAAGVHNSSGTGNSFFGTSAGSSNTTGTSNTFVGTSAGFLNATGSNNTFIGVSTGSDSGHTDLTQATAIGAFASVSTSNTIVLGTATETTNIPGKLAVTGLSTFSTLGSAGSTTLCRNGSNQLATCSSSLRYKTDLAPYNRGLDLINHLRPISFTWKDGGMRDLGFGAEDVAKIEPLLVTYNQHGQVEGLKYDRITAVLVNAVKEQQDQISKQRQQIESLTKLICADHPGADICK